MRRPLMLVLATSAVLATGAGLAAAPALASPTAVNTTGADTTGADTTVAVTYPVTGSTFIKAINSTVALGPGTLATIADLTTSTLTGTLTLPPATGSFKELGLI